MTDEPIAELISTPVDVSILEPETPITADVNVSDMTVDEPTGMKVLSPEEALGENQDEIENDMEMRLGKPSRDRDASGKFLPKKKEGEPKPVAQKPVAKSAPKPPAKPAPIAKVKIGEDEKTPEEWAAHFKELKDKAEKPPEPTKAPEIVKTKEELEAEKVAQTTAEKQTYSDFVIEHAHEFIPEDYGIDLSQENWDAILASGKVEPFREILAKTAAFAEMKSRQWAADAINDAHSKLAAAMKPIQEHHQRIAEYESENRFLTANKDINDHPEGRATFREINGKLRAYYDGLVKLSNEGKATPVEQARATLYKEMKPEEFDADIAHHTREALTKLPTAAKPAPKPAPVPPTNGNRAKPFNGDRPGGNSSPVSTTLDERLAAEFDARP